MPREFEKKMGVLFILLLKESQMFSIDSLVSIYTIENGAEEIIGLGYVGAVQDDKIIRVCVSYVFDDKKDDFKKIVENKLDILKIIFAKPSIPQKILSLTPSF